MSKRSQNQQLNNSTNPNIYQPHSSQPIIIIQQQQPQQTIRASNILSHLSNNRNRNQIQQQQILQKQQQQQSLIQQIENYYIKLEQAQNRQGIKNNNHKNNNDVNNDNDNDNNNDNNDDNLDDDNDNIDVDDQTQYLSYKHQILKLQQRYFMPIEEYIDIDKFIQDLKRNRQQYLRKKKQLQQKNVGGRNYNYKGQKQEKGYKGQEELNKGLWPEIRNKMIQQKINEFKFKLKRNKNMSNNQINGYMFRLFQQAKNIQQFNYISKSIYSNKSEQKIKSQSLQPQINQLKLKSNTKKKDANNGHFHPLYQIQAKRLKQMNQIKQQMYFILQQNQFQIFNKQQNILPNKQFFKNLIQNQNRKINGRLPQVRQSNQQDFQIKILNSTFDQEIVQIYCKYHNIGKKLIILNKINSQKQFSRLSLDLCGTIFKSQSYQYVFNWLDQKYLLQEIKWIQPQYYMKTWQKSDQNFLKLIKENKKIKSIIKAVFILNICAALKIGPYLPKINGFDLIIKKQQISFFTEEYQVIKDKFGCCRQTGEVFKAQILEDMLKMHSINFVNCCISPSCIGFSKKFQKPILIDYGISQILKQNIYQKSLVNSFRGVYHFCSDQMKQIFQLGRPARSYINLYLNDIHSITQSFDDMYNNQQNHVWQTNQLKVYLFYKDKNQNSTIKREQVIVTNFQQSYKSVLQNLIIHFKQQYFPQKNINQSLQISLQNKFKGSRQYGYIIIKTLIQSFKFLIYVLSQNTLSLQFMVKIEKLIQELKSIYFFNPKEVREKKLNDCQKFLFRWYLESQKKKNSYSFHAYREIYLGFIEQSKKFIKNNKIFNRIQQRVEVGKCQNQVEESIEFKYHHNYMIRHLILIKQQRFYLQQPKLTSNQSNKDYNKNQLSYQNRVLKEMVKFLNYRKDQINFSTNQQKNHLRQNYKYIGIPVNKYLEDALCSIEKIKKKYLGKGKEVKVIKNQYHSRQSIQYAIKKSEILEYQNLQDKFPRLINYIQVLLTYTSLQKQYRQSFDKQKRKKVLQNFIEIAQQLEIKEKCLYQIKRYNSREEENLRICKPKRNKMNQSHYDYIQVFQIIFIYMNNLMNKGIAKNINISKSQQTQSPNIAKNNYYEYRQKYQNYENESKNLTKICQFKFIQKHMFYILKNLIILGFDWQLFIKQYLQKCLYFMLKNSMLKHKLLLIFTKQLIQVGLLIKYVHNPFSYKYYEKAYNLFAFDINLYLQKHVKLESFRQFKSINKKLQIIHKMYIFVSPLEFVLLNTSSKDIKDYFIQLQKQLKKEQQQNLSINSNSNLKQFYQYQNLILIIKDLYQNYFNLSQNHFFGKSQQLYQMRQASPSLTKQNESNSFKNYYILTKNDHYNQQNVKECFIDQQQQIQSIQLLNQLFLEVKQKQLSYQKQKFNYVKLKFMNQESQYRRCQYWSFMEPIYLYKHHKNGQKIDKLTFYKLLKKSLQKLDSIIGQQSISSLIHLDLRLEIELWSKNSSIDKLTIFKNLSSYDNKGPNIKHHEIDEVGIHVNSVENIDNKSILQQQKIEDMTENGDFGIQFYIILARSIYLNSQNQSNLSRKQLLEWCSDGYKRQRNKLVLQLLSSNSEYKEYGNNGATISCNKYLYLKIILFQKQLMQQRQIRVTTQQIKKKSSQIKINQFDDKSCNLWRQNNYQSQCQINDNMNRIDELNEFLSIKSSSQQDNKYRQQLQKLYNNSLTTPPQLLIKPKLQQQTYYNHNKYQYQQNLNYKQYLIYQLLTKSPTSLSSQFNNSQQKSTLLLNSQQQLKYTNQLNQIILLKWQQRLSNFNYQYNRNNNNNNLSNNNSGKVLLKIDQMIDKVIQFYIIGLIKNKSQSLLVINNYNNHKQIHYPYDNHSDKNQYQQNQNNLNNNKNNTTNLIIINNSVIKNTLINNNKNNLNNNINNNINININININNNINNNDQVFLQQLQNQYQQYKSFITISYSLQNQHQQLLSINSLHYLQLNQQYYSLFIIDYIIHLCKHIYKTTLIFQSNNKQNRIQQNYQRLLQILKLPHILNCTTLKLIFQTILLVNKRNIISQCQQFFCKNKNQRLSLFQNIIPILKQLKLNMPSQGNFLALSGKFVIQEILQNIQKEKQDQEQYENEQQQQDGQYMDSVTIYKNLIHSYRSIVIKIILSDKKHNLVKQTIKNNKFQYHLKHQIQILIQLQCLTYIIQRQKYKYFNKGIRSSYNYQSSRLFVILRKIIRHLNTDNQHQHKNILPSNFIGFIIKEFLSFQFQYPKRQKLNKRNKYQKTKLHSHVSELFRQKMLKKRFRYLEIKADRKMQQQIIKNRQKIIDNDFFIAMRQQFNNGVQISMKKNVLNI